MEILFDFYPVNVKTMLTYFLVIICSTFDLFIFDR